MAYQSTFDAPERDTNAFYRRTLHVLSDARVPFLVGGSHAILHYTGIVRETKDFDLFVRPADLDPALEALRQAGYQTEVTFPHWLAKARDGRDVVDLVFNSGNGLCCIDDRWFEFATEADVLGMPVKIAPVEEMFWQKSFLMERERFDGADAAHILRSCAGAMDWDRLLDRYGQYWHVLFAHLVMYRFIYPSERDGVPRAVVEKLLELMRAELDQGNSEERVCQGTLVSRAQYLVDVGRYGYADARVAPRGTMSAEDCVYWTWAIANIE